MNSMKRIIFGILNLLPIFYGLAMFSAAAASAVETPSSPAAGGAERILAEIKSAAPETRGAAYEKLGRYIASKDVIDPAENALLEGALNLMIESDIRDAGAHAAAGELFIKSGNLARAYYHFEMAVMAAPYNFSARRKMNEVKAALAPGQTKASSNQPEAPETRAPDSGEAALAAPRQIGRASCRERV